MDTQQWEDLTRWEGVYRNLYRDSEGYCTIGVGFLVSNETDCARLPLDRPDGTRAGYDEKVAAYRAVMLLPPNMRPAYYERASDLRMGDQVIRDRVAREIDDRTRRLRTKIDGYDDLPVPVRRALLDMSWNLGIAGLMSYHRMLEAIERHDWDLAARESHRPGRRPARNIWTASLLREPLVSRG